MAAPWADRPAGLRDGQGSADIQRASGLEGRAGHRRRASAERTRQRRQTYGPVGRQNGQGSNGSAGQQGRGMGKEAQTDQHASGTGSAATMGRRASGAMGRAEQRKSNMSNTHNMAGSPVALCRFLPPELGV